MAVLLRVGKTKKEETGNYGIHIAPTRMMLEKEAGVEEGRGLNDGCL